MDGKKLVSGGADSRIVVNAGIGYNITIFSQSDIAIANNDDVDVSNVMVEEYTG
jgi:hypothetical protein